MDELKTLLARVTQAYEAEKVGYTTVGFTCSTLTLLFQQCTVATLKAQVRAQVETTTAANAHVVQLRNLNQVMPGWFPQRDI
jgi:hypothetical protein